MRKPFIVLGNINEDSFECPNPSPHHPKSIYIPSWEEVFKVLRRIFSFTEMEPLVQNMEALFLATQRIPIEVDEDPSQYFMAWLLYGIADIAIAHIIHMQDYIAFETTKVVSHPYLCHLWFFWFFFLVSCFIMIIVALK